MRCKCLGLKIKYQDITYMYLHNYAHCSSECLHITCRSALRACKPQGTVVYSTCTLTPGQNDYVVEGAISQLRQSHPHMEVVVQDTSNIADRLGHVFKFWSGSKYVLSNICYITTGCWCYYTV